MPPPGVERWSTDLNGIPDEAVAPLLREAREYLQGTVTMGFSSDQRSVTLGGVLAAGGFALFTVVAGAFSGNDPNLTALSGAAVAGTLLIIASGFCLLAAFPSKFNVGGYAPRDLSRYADDTLWMDGATLIDFQRRIDENIAALEEDARMIRWAIRCAFAGIGFGGFMILLGIIRRIFEDPAAFAMPIFWFSFLWY